MKNKSFFQSLKHAGAGLWYIIRSERSFRIQLSFAVLVWFFGFNIWEVYMLTTAIFLILVLECINTAFENLADLITKKFDLTVKIIKDTIAATVLIASVFSISFGAFLFLRPQKIIEVWNIFLQKPYLFFVTFAIILFRKINVDKLYQI